ncbi:MAG: formate dehydrogenase accessory sulfurtransferase FdhD [Bacteroidota bacterium]
MSLSTGLDERTILRFRKGQATPQMDTLAVEEPLDIRVNTDGRVRSVAITMRTPGEDEDLALGFLFTEGVLGADAGAVQVQRSKGKTPAASANVVEVVLPAGQSIDWKRLERHSYTSSSCGVCGKTSLEQVYTAIPFAEDNGSSFSIPPCILQALPAKLRSAQVLFDQTGGIHAAGLFDLSGRLLYFAEDVGRHNALDKLIGYALRQDLLPLDQHLLLLSGRASFELIQKAGMAGIQLVAAVGAPSSLAASLSEELGMTLCGFTSEQGFNCYFGEGRIEI